MSTVFIFHGTGGHPQENWFGWLKTKLEKERYTVIVPQFPTPQNQSPKTWFEVLEKHRHLYGPDTILIGHSLGGAFALRVLERYNTQIAAAYIVAAPVGVRPIKNWEGDQPFIGHPFDWELIRSRARKFAVYHSDNDPYVGKSNGELTAQRLEVPLTFVPGAGHFNTSVGYTQFPDLLSKIKSNGSI